MRRLRPGSLDELGLASALRDMVDEWRSRHDPDCELRIDGEVPDHSDALNIHVFRIVQEALNNVEKHASATRVQVDLRCAENDVLTICISDDGRGFDDESATGGLGLLGIRERVAILNGSLSVDSAAGRGSRLTVHVPLSAID